MDKDQLIDRIKVLLKEANLLPEEYNDLLSKLDGSTMDQLRRLHDNLIQQIAVNAHFDHLEKLEKEDKLLSEEEIDDLINKFPNV